MTDVSIQKLECRIYDGSISVGEHRSLRAAIDQASHDGTVTLVDVPGGNAAIVPVAVLNWYLAAAAGPCPACGNDRHEDCPRHYSGEESVPCGCDQRSTHRSILAAQMSLYRAGRRR